MIARVAPPRITSFLVKVASRCNLDCDYCYVYHHADQSWRSMPKLLSGEDRAAFARRLADYTREAEINRCVVVLHGGEPLLVGVDAITEFAQDLRAAVDPGVTVDLGMQTNGLLVTSAILDQLEEAEIAVSLSLDGPREANDLHRNSRKGRSSFDRVMNAFDLLKARPTVFAGVIAVIDPRISPESLFEFFNEHEPPKVDFLLPDAHHRRLPPGRDVQPNLYRDWLIRAFDVWFDQYAHLPVRTFEALLDAAAGLPSGTDAFGLGDVSLISIETDGSYHDLDVFKVVADGATRLHGSVRDTAISDVAASPALDRHRKLLKKEGLCSQCQSCPVVEICGGGSLPHRFGGEGFDHPSVYCSELLGLISHVKERLAACLDDVQVAPSNRLPETFDLRAYEEAELGTEAVGLLCDDARAAHAATLAEALAFVVTDDVHGPSAKVLLELAPEQFTTVAVQPGAVAWSRAYIAARSGRVIHDVDGVPVSVDASYVEHLCSFGAQTSSTLAASEYDPWLRVPFGSAIVFEPEEVCTAAAPVVEEALAIIRKWRPALAHELALACRTIQFVQDPTAHPEKIVSFSDNSVPGALFVSVRQGDQLIDPYDLADSLVHEHRHQKLYLLERFTPMVEATEELVTSPWREDLRPPSGLLHAIFVFIELRRYWLYVRDHGPARLHNRAVNQLQDTDRHLDEAFETLRSCRLTVTGRDLAAILDRARSATPTPA